MNSVHIIGRITKDLEVKATPTGKSVLNFTVAIPRFRKDDGADFANCVAWNKTAENMGRFLKKGDRISVTGKLQSRTYEDKDKKKIYVTEILAEEVEFLEPKRAEDPAEAIPSTDGFTDVNPDDLPF